MITAASLKSHSIKDLGRLAEKYSVPGWKSLKKGPLINAIVKAATAQSKSKGTGPKAAVFKSKKAAATLKRVKEASSSGAKPVAKGAPQRVTASAPPKTAKTKTAGSLKSQVGKAVEAKAKPEKPAKPRNPRILERIQKANAEREGRKDLSRDHGNGHISAVEPQNGHSRQPTPSRIDRDRIVLMVRDAYWLHAYWEITRQSVQRAQAAMAEQWHTARPILRVIEVDAGATTSAAERVVREISVHGGVTNWYIDVPNPPRSFRVDLGYLASNGRFYSLARSNVVATPNPGSNDEVDPHWTDVAENFEKIYALSGGFSDDHTTGDLQDLFEERLRRPMKNSSNAGFGSGAERALRRERDFHFDIDAEMLIHGQTKPGGHVTIGGAPVKVKPDGSFAVRLAMPDKRQVLPLVARSGDGVEHRTIVLAVERNTKVMEPMVKEVTE